MVTVTQSEKEREEDFRGHRRKVSFGGADSYLRLCQEIDKQMEQIAQDADKQKEKQHEQKELNTMREQLDQVLETQRKEQERRNQDEQRRDQEATKEATQQEPVEAVAVPQVKDQGLEIE